MSSEQPWPTDPPDLAQSQPQYGDPYQGQPYSYGGASQDAAQQGYAAGDGYGYAGYGDAYGYATGQTADGYATGQTADGYATGQTADGYATGQTAGAGYAGSQPDAGSQSYAGYAGYGQYDQYGQYQQYDQYGQQPYAGQYAQPAEAPYTQPYEDQYAQSSYAGTYAQSPQAPQPAPSAEDYPAWNEPGPETSRRYAGVAEEPGSSRGWPGESDEPDEHGVESPAGPKARAARDEPVRPPEEERQPKPKRRRRRTVGVIVVIVILAGAGAYEFLGGSSSNSATGTAANSTGNSGTAGGAAASGSAGSASGSASPSMTPAASVAIPSSAGGLTEMTNKVGKAGVSAMQKSASSNADLANAQFAEYEKTGTSTFFGNLTLAQLSKAPDIQKTYTLSGATGTLKALGATSLKDGQTETPGVPGSAMACGQFTTGGNTLSLCIWVDPSEFGLFAGPKSLTDSQAAQYAEAIETASEH